MGAYKTTNLYPFLEELKLEHAKIKKEILEVEEKINSNTRSINMIENFNSASSFYKNKSWNPLFAIAQQGQSWQEFMRDHQFIPGRETLQGLDLIMGLEAIKEYYKTHIPYTEKVLSELFRKNKNEITNIYIWRLDGNKGKLPLHTNYDPHMYRCHFGVLGA